MGGIVVFGGVRSPISFLILFVSFTELTLLFGWLGFELGEFPGGPEAATEDFSFFIAELSAAAQRL